MVKIRTKTRQLNNLNVVAPKKAAVYISLFSFCIINIKIILIKVRAETNAKMTQKCETIRNPLPVFNKIAGGMARHRTKRRYHNTDL